MRASPRSAPRSASSPGDPGPADPVAAAEALNAAAATRADAGAVLLIAVGMVRRAQQGGGTFDAARRAVGPGGLAPRRLSPTSPTWSPR